MNTTIAKYREGLRQHPGLATIVDAADLAALLDIAEALDAIATGVELVSKGGREPPMTWIEVRDTARSALARLNGDKQKEPAP